MKINSESWILICLFQNKNMAEQNRIETFHSRNGVLEEDKVVSSNISFSSFNFLINNIWK